MKEHEQFGKALVGALLILKLFGSWRRRREELRHTARETGKVYESAGPGLEGVQMFMVMDL